MIRLLGNYLSKLFVGNGLKNVLSICFVCKTVCHYMQLLLLISLSLSRSLSNQISIFQSVHLSVNIILSLNSLIISGSVCLSVTCKSVCLSFVSLFICLSVHRSFLFVFHSQYFFLPFSPYALFILSFYSFFVNSSAKFLLRFTTQGWINLNPFLESTKKTLFLFHFFNKNFISNLIIIQARIAQLVHIGLVLGRTWVLIMARARIFQWQ